MLPSDPDPNTDQIQFVDIGTDTVEVVDVSDDPTEEPDSDGLICNNDPNTIDKLPLLGTTPNLGTHSTVSHQFVLSTTTLRETLQFKPSNKDFNEKFFQSMDGRVLNPDIEAPGESKFLFMTLKIKRVDLDKDNFIIKWSVDSGGKYTSSLGSRSDPSIFGLRLVGDEETVEDCDDSREMCTYYTAQCHAFSKPSCPNGMIRGGDNIMVSPGTRSKGMSLPGDGQSNRQLGDYMSSWAEEWGHKVTSYQEKCQLWSLVGKVAIERLEGKLDRRKTVEGVQWPMSVYQMRDNVDEHGNPGEGLDEVAVYTHGRKVPWFHVRVESYMEHPIPETSSQDRGPGPGIVVS